MSNITKTIVELNLMSKEQQVHQDTSIPCTMKREYEPVPVYNQCQSFTMNKKLKEESRDLGIAPYEHRKVKDGDTVQKLKAFFECLQKQHPESRLELQYVDSSWKVWCGVCKKFLRPDKSGKALHNIQKQHFTASRHKKNLHLLLHGEDEAAQKAAAEKKGRQ